MSIYYNIPAVVGRSSDCGDVLCILLRFKYLHDTFIEPENDTHATFELIVTNINILI